MKRVFKVLAGVNIVITYARYGRTSRQRATTTLLDPLLPGYEVREVYHVAVRAPAGVMFAAAHTISFDDSPVVRSLLALRALRSRLTGATVAPIGRRPVIEKVLALGWRQIGKNPGRQIVTGAVTRPWKQAVEFRGLLPDEFTAFGEPGYAKITWTIETDPTDQSSSVFRTETRVGTTGPVSRERFRRYWSLLSPGIRLIRYETLRLVKAEAERRAAAVSTVTQVRAG